MGGPLLVGGLGPWAPWAPPKSGPVSIIFKMAFVLVHLNVIFLLCRLTNAVRLWFHKLVSWLACNCKTALILSFLYRCVYLSVSVCFHLSSASPVGENGSADFNEIWQVGLFQGLIMHCIQKLAPDFCVA